MIKQVFTALFSVTLEKEMIKPRGRVGEEKDVLFYYIRFLVIQHSVFTQFSVLDNSSSQQFPTALDSFITETTGYIFSWQMKGQIPR